MTYLLLQILASLVLVAVVAFAFGWYLRGLRERSRNRFHGE